MLLTATPPSLTPVMVEGACATHSINFSNCCKRLQPLYCCFTFAAGLKCGKWPLFTWESAMAMWGCRGFAGGPVMLRCAPSTMAGTSALDGATPFAEGGWVLGTETLTFDGSCSQIRIYPWLCENTG